MGWIGGVGWKSFPLPPIYQPTPPIQPIHQNKCPATWQSSISTPYFNQKSAYAPENSHQLPSALQSDIMSLPALPIPLHDFIPYIAKHEPKKALEPFKVYESKLREVFAQKPDDAIAADPRANILPLFDGHEKNLKIRARDMSESIFE